jgi:hypothetical protein
MCKKMIERRPDIDSTGRDPRRFAALPAFAVAWFVAGAGSEALAQGCAMCRTALGGPEDPLSRGISISVLVLLSMPFAILATVGGWFFYMFRRERRRSTLRLLRTQKEGAS